MAELRARGLIYQRRRACIRYSSDILACEIGIRFDIDSRETPIYVYAQSYVTKRT